MRLNRTLSNPVTRIVINVGIAYGSDTERARELLLKAAEEHPNGSDDPAPFATFEGFGDNALNFLLHWCIPNLDNCLATITDLHHTIDDAFRKAEIPIAFPQRDVHLDAMGLLEVRVRPEQNAGPQTDRSTKSSDTEER